jgi:hypothetical protein
MSTLLSAHCGQAALVPLDPSKKKSQVLHNLADHTIPPKLQTHKKTLTSDGTAGMEVFKVTKVRMLFVVKRSFENSVRKLQENRLISRGGALVLLFTYPSCLTDFLLCFSTILY